MDGWVAVWLDEQLAGWMDSWINEWTDLFQTVTTLVYPVWFYLAVLCSGCLFSLAENTVMILTTVADSPWQTPSKICLLFEVTRCLFTMVVFSRALLVRVLQQEWSGAMQQLPSAHLQ